MSSVNLFEHRDYHAFLAAWFEARQRRPSMRSFASRVGCSPATVSMVVSGAQRLQERWLEPFADVLRLDDNEREYFRMLVEYERAPSEELKRMIDRRMAEVARFQSSRKVTEGTEKLFRHWYYAAIADLVECEGFVDEPAWIAARLNPPITEEQAREAVEVLLEIGRLKRVGDTIVGEQPAWVTPHQLTESALNEAVRGLHADVAALAARSMTAFSGDVRQAVTLSMPIPRRLVPVLQKAIHGLVEQVIELAAREASEAEVVYQFSTYLFPVADPGAGERED
jgi:uncharacterized protein (TIGR02147 family)